MMKEKINALVFVFQKGFVWFGVLMLSSVFGQAQTIKKDFDILNLPIARSLQPKESDFSAPRVEAKGFSVLPVMNPEGVPFPLGQVQGGPNSLEIEIDAGEAVLLWSNAIPMQATSVHFMAKATISGATPQQAAIAWLDPADPAHLGASLAFGKEIPRQNQHFEYAFQHNADEVILMLQFLGPAKGSSRVRLSRMRVTAGFQKMALALAERLVSAPQRFNQEGTFRINRPPTTLGGFAGLLKGETRLTQAGQVPRALWMVSSNAFDVIQVRVPFQPDSIQEISDEVDREFYGRAYVKRMAGAKGVLSIALFNGESGSGGFREYPIADIPQDSWLRIETPARLRQENAQAPLFILQIRGGPAQLVVDDVSIRELPTSPIFWNSKDAEGFLQD